MDCNDDDIFTAMMLLENVGEEGCWEHYGIPWVDFVVAAHSFIQHSYGGPHSWSGAEALVAKIRMMDAITDAKNSPPEVE